MKRFTQVAIIATILSVLFGIAPAFAGTDTTAPTTTVTNYASSVSADQAQVTDHAHVDTSVASNVVYYVQANGMTKAQKAAGKKKATHAKPATVVIHSTQTLWTSYCRLPNGVGVDANQCLHVSGATEVWHWKTYAAGHKFFLAKDGYYHDGPCFNKVIVHVPHAKKLPKKAHKITGSITVKKRSSYVATATAKVTLTVKATAQASCGDSANGASATAYGYGYAYAYAKATVSGSSKASVEASAKSAANKLVEKVKFADKDVANANTTAGGSASASASVKVTCSSTPTQPQPKAPEIISWTQIQAENGMEEGGYSANFKVTVSVPNGDDATLRLSTVYGHFAMTTDPNAPAVSTFTVHDGDTITVVYFAPDDTTTSNLTETLKANLTDNVTGLKAPELSQSFTVKPKAVHPA